MNYCSLLERTRKIKPNKNSPSLSSLCFEFGALKSHYSDVKAVETKMCSFLELCIT